MEKCVVELLDCLIFECNGKHSIIMIQNTTCQALAELSNIDRISGSFYTQSVKPAPALTA